MMIEIHFMPELAKYRVLEDGIGIVDVDPQALLKALLVRYGFRATREIMNEMKESLALVGAN